VVFVWAVPIPSGVGVTTIKEPRERLKPWGAEIGWCYCPPIDTPDLGQLRPSVLGVRVASVILTDVAFVWAVPSARMEIRIPHDISLTPYT